MCLLLYLITSETHVLQSNHMSNGSPLIHVFCTDKISSSTEKHLTLRVWRGRIPFTDVADSRTFECNFIPLCELSLVVLFEAAVHHDDIPWFQFPILLIHKTKIYHVNISCIIDPILH